MEYLRERLVIVVQRKVLCLQFISASGIDGNYQVITVISSG